MRIIEQSAENWTQSDFTIKGIYDQIERVARVCYKSEDKATGDSKEFVEKLIKNKHYAMLEHGTVYLYVALYNGISNPLNKYASNPYSKIRTWFDASDNKIHTYVTTNYRVLIENDWLEDLKYQCEPTEYCIKRYTLKLTTSIGIVRELLRHRKFSFANESTRYVSSCEKRNIKEFDCDCIEDIIDAYNQGFSMREIAQYSSLSESSIRARLLNNGIQLRGLHSTGKRDENYFNVVDTPEKAYLLGLIQTDGNVRMTERNASLSITQHKDYSWYIENMLHLFSDKVTKVNDNNCHQLMIGSKDMVSNLISIGIVPNKTYVQTKEDAEKLWDTIPEEYKGDFIRGLIDGDGWVRYFTQKRGINESCSIGLCSKNEAIIDIVIKFIGDKFNYHPGKRYDSSVYKFSITDKNKSIEIGKFLYKNFQYPFGHPKKASTWIKRLEIDYPIANFKDPKFMIIRPYWIGNCTPEAIFTFLHSISCSEDAYTSIRLGGYSPQQAREVLPLCTKSELVVTGFEDDWNHFFDLRLYGKTGAPHPDMKDIAEKAYVILAANVFEELKDGKRKE